MQDWPCYFFTGPKLSVAQVGYRQYVEDGIAMGRRQDLVGGGLLRSQGGWAAVKAMRSTNAYQKGDERILGDSDFVEKVLRKAGEKLERKLQLTADGFDFGFSINKKYETMVAEVSNRQTGEVIGQIPSEEILALRDKMKELTGLFFDEKL